jgi:hypothetical protein
MHGPLVAIIGSPWKRARDGTRLTDADAVKHESRVRAACEAFGRELAKAGCRLIVYSAEEHSIEPDVVRGFVAVDKTRHATGGRCAADLPRSHHMGRASRSRSAVDALQYWRSGVRDRAPPARADRFRTLGMRPLARKGTQASIGPALAENRPGSACMAPPTRRRAGARFPQRARPTHDARRCRLRARACRKDCT